MTPHILANDLASGICSANDIVMIVVDEAHRATGNYAYCEVVRGLLRQQANFRILALTATPGSDIKTVSQVAENLRISRIEIRTEESMDIVPYIHHRALETVVVALSEPIKNLQNCFASVMSLFLKRLNDQKVFHEKNPLNVSSYMLILSRDRFRQANRGSQARASVVAGFIEGAFGVAISLATSYALLYQHGIRTFYSSMLKYKEDTQAKGSKASKASQEVIRHPQFIYLMDHIPSLMKKQNFSSHIKMERLTEIVLNHFQDFKSEESGTETRAIIFSQYRESVEEIVAHLNKHQPLVRVMSFVGQASGAKGKKGLTQKEQLQVISRFQSGGYNVLVSTSIGEEGLDIGQVDLIICYDSQNSPIRMLQRMGRTGRKRKGRVVLLLTQGKEEDAYKRSQSQYKSVQVRFLL